MADRQKALVNAAIFFLRLPVLFCFFFFKYNALHVLEKGEAIKNKMKELDEAT